MSRWLPMQGHAHFLLPTCLRTFELIACRSWMNLVNITYGSRIGCHNLPFAPGRIFFRRLITRFRGGGKRCQVFRFRGWLSDRDPGRVVFLSGVILKPSKAIWAIWNAFQPLNWANFENHWKWGWNGKGWAYSHRSSLKCSVDVSFSRDNHIRVDQNPAKGWIQRGWIVYITVEGVGRGEKCSKYPKHIDCTDRRPETNFEVIRHNWALLRRFVRRLFSGGCRRGWKATNAKCHCRILFMGPFGVTATHFPSFADHNTNPTDLNSLLNFGLFEKSPLGGCYSGITQDGDLRPWIHLVDG